MAPSDDHLVTIESSWGRWEWVGVSVDVAQEIWVLLGNPTHTEIKSVTPQSHGEAPPLEED